MKTPVVFVVFNRPELTRRVFQRIREAKPSTLLVVCDGPRSDHLGDCGKVDEVRAIIANGVDWPCDVYYEYSIENLGCRERVASGLSWAFSRVEEAIILEDDCLPSPDFFHFAEEMLARYRDDLRVFHVGSNNFTGDETRLSESYGFSRYGHIWGWATWRRAWTLYEWDISSWKNPDTRREILMRFQLSDERGYWGSIFDRCSARPREETTWDYQWTYTCWKHEGLAIYPAVHLVQNIGLGTGSTHTHQANALFSKPSSDLPRPLTHPCVVEAQANLDRAIFRTVFMPKRPLGEKAWHYLANRLMGAS